MVLSLGWGRRVLCFLHFLFLMNWGYLLWVQSREDASEISRVPSDSSKPQNARLLKLGCSLNWPSGSWPSSQGGATQLCSQLCFCYQGHVLGLQTCGAAALWDMWRPLKRELLINMDLKSVRKSSRTKTIPSLRQEKPGMNLEEATQKSLHFQGEVEISLLRATQKLWNFSNPLRQMWLFSCCCLMTQD